MPIPEPIVGTVFCDLAARWIVDQDVMFRMQAAVTFMNTERAYASILRTKGIPISFDDGVPVMIISGHRTVARQEELRAAGRPTAPPGRSTHTSCPATGIDLRIPGHMDPTNSDTDRVLWADLGRAAERLGLRWGGGSPRDRFGLPSDFNHFDKGPRAP